MLADAWRELERSLAAVAVAKGSREHCAQLAELTFGWSGRLTATLRAPLTDHVDGCTRCQHYLHTVIGTPAAPTILPFVAAPRSLREILLGELHDPKTARAQGRAQGVDHAAIARRLTHFTADGFPMAEEPNPVRRRGTRRPQERPRGQEALPRRTPRANLPRAVGEGGAPEVDEASVPGPRRAVVPTAGDGIAGGSVYRAPGSWAARVLPPQDDDAEAARHWRPAGSAAASTAAASTATSSTGVSGASSPEARRDVSGTHYGSGASSEPGRRRRPTFVDTPSGRFALHAPAPGSASASGSTPGDGTGAGRLSRTQTLRFAAPAADPPRGPDGQPRARHKSRPVRQAVTSAVALGAVGAMAAVSAALLGLTSEDRAQATLGDPGLSLPTGPGPDSGGLSVTVSTAPAAAPASTAASAPVRSRGGTAAPVAGIGTSGRGASSPPSTGGGQPTADPADFHVSVNQRSADPNSITILLRDTGPAPISWTATDQDSWIVLSQSAGTLGAGQSQVITATATSAAPPGQWTSRIAFAPGGTVITVRGGAATTPPPSTAPPNTTPPGTPSPPPPPPTPPSPSPTPPRTSSPSAPTPTSTGAPSSAGAGAPTPSSVRQGGGVPSPSATGRSAGTGSRRK